MPAPVAALALVALVAGFTLRGRDVSDPTRPVTIEPFVLKDALGRTHQPTDWRDASAVVLFVIGADCPVSGAYAAEMRRLAERYGPKGVVFLGVQPDPSVSGEAVVRHAEDHGLLFPILLDPSHELTGELGAEATPEAAVLDARRHLRYRGRIDHGNALGGTSPTTSEGRKLEGAILAAIDDATATMGPLDGDDPRTVGTARPVLPGDRRAHSSSGPGPLTRPPGTLSRGERARGEGRPGGRGSPAQPTCRAEASPRPLPRPRPIVAEDETITFHEHVAPIVWRHCAGCHRPGEVGPFSLLTYKDAAKRAGFLRDVTASREMPPWPAVHGYGDFHDAGRLGRRELAVLARWAEDGAPEGVPAVGTGPPTFPEGWQLGTPDLVATMPEPFVVPADTRDIYRAFVLPLPLDRDTAVAAVEFRRGNRRVVHHARFYVDPTDECRRRDAAGAGPGFESFGGGDILKPGLGAWVPGLIPRMPPPDVGKVVRKGSDLILLVHYHGTGKEEVDRSSVGLFFCKTPPARRTSTISLSSTKIDIPPGESRHRIALTAYMKADAHALSVLPHGHFLMREISLRATLPAGQVVPLLWIDDWDFNWQGQYHFARPVPLPKGTRLDVVAYYDNSAENPFNPHRPPRRVKLGWASTDEMLGCHVQVIADDDASQRVLDKATPFGL